MRQGRLWIVGVLALLLVGGAFAHGPRPYYPRSSIHFGVMVGDPWFYPPYAYPPGVVYWPRVYVPPLVVEAPPVYVERSVVPPVTVPLEPGYWYYCAEARAYYPQVNACPGGWQKVAPAPER